ncbi:unnamed protein product [Prunus brigantina]
MLFSQHIRTLRAVPAVKGEGGGGGEPKICFQRACLAPKARRVRNCSRFRIIPTGLTVVLNETALHESMASDSPLDSPMSQDSPIQKEPRPIGRKAAKAKRGSNSSNNTSTFLEEIARPSAMRIEIDMKTQEDEREIQVEYAKEREYVRKESIERNDRETMAMDTSHMSLETKQFWKLERTDVMRRRLFRDDGPSNMDWLNDQNH